ncbi:MAG: thioredoxin domain-containing protein [Marinilabiliales bacterium]|nr:MAG: thioredoxin domain-containing protein [Marinilabiliales bacterium]
MNKLKYASSPYLLQHANNPVHWYEWGEEAFTEAKKNNKPLIISIGYAACHWCHVMEHQSFSEKDVAAFMNDNFVCIKVDREERPDVDRIYMDAAQMINGQGGWPLNAFALPDGKPFFAGTYFPKERWLDILAKISDLYNNDYQKVCSYAEQLTEGINSQSENLNIDKSESTYNKEDYLDIINSFSSQIDYELGGFKRAPKFPLPIAWEFLLQYYYLTKSEEVLDVVKLTLNEMAKGGIYDQIGGGFARYSVDELWKVPHFEKMLYDNAQLISLYSHAFQITLNHSYADIIEQSFDFVMRELSDENGGFYSSLNADSEGEEGQFYVWTYGEIEKVLKDHNFELISKYYNIKAEGNWEKGKNILFTKLEKVEFAKANNIKVEEFNKLVNEANKRLFEYRSKRERPSTDNKILTSWNALMLKACVDAYKALGNEKYLNAAIKNAEFLENYMMEDDGFLYRNHMNSKSTINAFLDDYAALSEAFMDLYGITFNKKWLDNSKLLAEYCIDHFCSDDSPMFYYTADNSESLIARTYEITDNVIPASNSIIANVLYKLGHYYDKTEFITKAEQMFVQVKDKITESGPWFAKWGLLQAYLSNGLPEIAILGDNFEIINKEIQQEYLPLSIFMGGQSEDLPLLKNRLVEGKSMIYVCRNKTCKLPAETVAEALNQID